MSLYADYIREREGFETIEDDKGFATYKFNYTRDCDGHCYCYIRDIFVKPEFRRSRAASHYADLISEKARLADFTHLLGSVYIDEEGTTSLKVLLGYGFKLSHTDGNLIYFKKEL